MSLTPQAGLVLALPWDALARRKGKPAESLKFTPEQSKQLSAAGADLTRIAQLVHGAVLPEELGAELCLVLRKRLDDRVLAKPQKDNEGWDRGESVKRTKEGRKDGERNRPRRALGDATRHGRCSEGDPEQFSLEIGE